MASSKTTPSHLKQKLLQLSSLVLLQYLDQDFNTKIENMNKINKSLEENRLCSSAEKLNNYKTTNRKKVSSLLPSLNPLLNLRGTLRIYLILPVPVVFLLIAFTLQLSESRITIKIKINPHYI